MALLRQALLASQTMPQVTKPASASSFSRVCVSPTPCSLHPHGNVIRLCNPAFLFWSSHEAMNLSTVSAKSTVGGRGRLKGSSGNGIKEKRGMVVARAGQYDDSLSVTTSTTDERYRENGASSSSFDQASQASGTQEAYLQGGSSFSAHTAKILQGNPKANFINKIENRIERAIFDCRFLTLFGVVGSLLGAVLCFLKGCLYVSHSYMDYIRACIGTGAHTSRVILYLVEAVDVYLMGTVMLIFGMGLYELFVSSLEVPSYGSEVDGANKTTVCGSNLFGLFRIRQRPKWLEIRSLDELKTKLGHVIVMILLVGMFEKSKKVVVHSSMDFLCFSASILLSSAALYLLSILHNSPVNEA